VSPNLLRQGPVPLEDPSGPLPDASVVHLDGPATVDKSGRIDIELPDGSVVIHPFGAPRPRPKKDANDFYRNLAEEIPESELSALAYELCLGVEADIQSVAERNADLAAGIKMLGVKLEDPTRS